MAKIIAVIGGKGGIGKSTAATTLAECWGRKGKRVNVVDADDQLSSAEIHDTLENPHYSCAPYFYADIDKKIEALAGDSDYTIIDCAGRVSKLMDSVISVADLIIMPVLPSGVDYTALGRTVATIENSVTKPNAKLVFFLNKVSPNNNSILAKITRAELEKISGGFQTAKAEIKLREAHPKAAYFGETVFDYKDKKAANDYSRLALELEGYLNA